jgi:hypothetical protein
VYTVPSGNVIFPLIIILAWDVKSGASCDVFHHAIANPSPTSGSTIHSRLNANDRYLLNFDAILKTEEVLFDEIRRCSAISIRVLRKVILWLFVGSDPKSRNDKGD